MPITSEQVTLESLGSGVAGIPADAKTRAYQAAEAYVAGRCSWPAVAADGTTVLAAPASLVLAVQLLTARYLERRNSPSGVVGMGDLGVVRVSGSDRDVDALMAPYRRLVLG
jgi:hypothetical protein